MKGVNFLFSEYRVGTHIFIEKWKYISFPLKAVLSGNFLKINLFLEQFLIYRIIAKIVQRVPMDPTPSVPYY